MPEIPEGSQTQIARSNEGKSHNPLSNLLNRVRAARQPKDIKSQPVSQETFPPFYIEPGRDIDQLYEELKQHEGVPADRNEQIKIIGLKSFHPEFGHLQSVGVELSDLQTDHVTRGALLDAGYVFVNRIGGGEKPLINAQVPMAVDNGIETVELGKKVLLNQEELDAALEYQKSQPGFIVENADPEAVRKDMLLFLQQAVAEQNGLAQKSNSMFRAAQGRILEDPQYTEEDREALRQFFAKQYGEYQAGSSNLGYIMQECMAGIDLAKVRGVPLEIMSKRLSSLQGTPSPFLDSGFHFDTNYDVTLYPHDHSQTRRLNMAVIHLLSRGLSEMGESTNDSHDQRYITAGEYEEQVYGREMLPEDKTSDETLDLIARRLLARAGVKKDL